MKYISKAPFRIGLAGGGTDVSPYSDQYGGAILNAAINLCATVILIPRDDDKVIITAKKRHGDDLRVELNAEQELPEVPELRLQVGVYNHIIRTYTKKPLACELICTMDVATGSGLGTSSTLVIATIGAFVEWLKLPLSEYDIARMAVSIEREELQMAGGKQDQYAATFGGVNFMEFHENNSVVVNPLRIKPDILSELEFHLLLFYSQTKRESSKIIEVQKENFEKSELSVLEATHKLKDQAFTMKEALLKGELDKIGAILKDGWQNKKQLAKGISNSVIDNLYDTALTAGASGGKISGAGGGGFMIFYCPGVSRYDVIEAMEKEGAILQPYRFQTKGLDTWTSYQ